MASKTGTELFLVDNSDADWKVLRYAWTEGAGHTKWYLFALDTDLPAASAAAQAGKIADEPSEIIGLIRSKPDTPRHRAIEEKTLSEIRAPLNTTSRTAT